MSNCCFNCKCEQTSHHLYGNDAGSGKRGFRNRSFHRQGAVSGERGRDFGGVHFRWQPESQRDRVNSSTTSNEPVAAKNTQTGVSWPLTLELERGPNCLLYLYFRVKHLAMNPCSSRRSSCLPGDGLPFHGVGEGGCEEDRGESSHTEGKKNTQHRLN